MLQKLSLTSNYEYIANTQKIKVYTEARISKLHYNFLIKISKKYLMFVAVKGLQGLTL